MLTEWLTDKLYNLKNDLLRAHKSLTLWFNGLCGALVVALPIAQENFLQLQQYVSPQFYKQAMTVLIVGNILLRFRTTSALKDK